MLNKAFLFSNPMMEYLNMVNRRLGNVIKFLFDIKTIGFFLFFLQDFISSSCCSFNGVLKKKINGFFFFINLHIIFFQIYTRKLKKRGSFPSLNNTGEFLQRIRGQNSTQLIVQGEKYNWS